MIMDAMKNNVPMHMAMTVTILTKFWSSLWINVLLFCREDVRPAILPELENCNEFGKKYFLNKENAYR